MFGHQSAGIGSADTVALKQVLSARYTLEDAATDQDTAAHIHHVMRHAKLANITERYAQLSIQKETRNDNDLYSLSTQLATIAYVTEARIPSAANTLSN